jgi:hypothetical protein
MRIQAQSSIQDAMPCVDLISHIKLALSLIFDVIKQIETPGEEHEVLERKRGRCLRQLPLCFLDESIIKFGPIYLIGD